MQRNKKTQTKIRQNKTNRFCPLPCHHISREKKCEVLPSTQPKLQLIVMGTIPGQRLKNQTSRLFGAIIQNNHPQEPHFQIPAEYAALSVCYPPLTTLQKCRSFNFIGVAPDRRWCKSKPRLSSSSSFITFTYIPELTDVMSDTSWNQNKQHTEGNAYSSLPRTEGLKRLTSKQLPQRGRMGDTQA